MSDTRAVPLALPRLPGLVFRPILGASDTEGLRAVHETRAALDRVDLYDYCDDWPSLGRAGHRHGAAALVRSAHPGAGGGRASRRALGVRRQRQQHRGRRHGAPAAGGYTAPYHVLSLALDPALTLLETPLPPGIVLRPVLPKHLPLIAASIGEAYAQQPVVEGTVKGRYDEAYDPVAYAADLATPRHDPTLWQVAWEGDALVGQVLTRLDEGRAEVFEMSVRPAWRRRGIARALLVRSIAALRARGIEEIRVHTVQEFPTHAVDVYRAAGFRVVKTFPRYRKAGSEQGWTG